MQNTFENLCSAHQTLIDAVHNTGIEYGFVDTRIDPNAEEEPTARNEILEIISDFGILMKTFDNLKFLNVDEAVIVSRWMPELYQISKTFADPTMMYFEDLYTHIQQGWINLDDGKALKNDFMLMQAAANGIIGDRNSEITSLEYLKSLNGQVSEGAEYFVRVLVPYIYSNPVFNEIVEHYCLAMSTTDVQRYYISYVYLLHRVGSLQHLNQMQEWHLASMIEDLEGKQIIPSGDPDLDPLIQLCDAVATGDLKFIERVYREYQEDTNGYVCEADVTDFMQNVVPHTPAQMRKGNSRLTQADLNNLFGKYI